jgi:superfamily II DNA or RNA helicase
MQLQTIGGVMMLVNPPSISYQLRPYQFELLAKICYCWGKSQNRVMAQLPTGGGKTILFCEIARGFASKGQKVLVLAHREELILQAHRKLEAISGLPVGIIKNGYKPNYSALIQVASVQSMVNRITRVEDIGLVIVDEAHHATANTYRKVLKAYPDAFVLGVTATPIRLDGSGFRELFDELVCGVTVSELIDQGSLSKYKMFADAEPMTTKGARQKGGDYSASSIAKLNPAAKLAASLVGSYEKYAYGKQCIVFAVDVAHSRTIAEAYCLSGIPACHLDGTSNSEDRASVLKRFASGELKVITNCALFDEGLDIPSIEAVQIAKPTKSLSRWLQMLGRGLRPAEGKEHAILIDHTDNWANHGLPTDPRMWTLDGVEGLPKAKKSQRNSDGEIVEVEPLRSIDIINVNMAEVTSSDRWRLKTLIKPILKKDQQPKPPIVVIIPEDTPAEDILTFRELERLLNAMQDQKLNPSWVYNQLAEIQPPYAVWREAGRQFGFKPAWAKYRYQDQINDSLECG